MTKQIRVENADTSNHKVEVQVWDEYPGQPANLVKTVSLDHPTSLATECIHSGRYLVIKEKTE